MEFVTQIVSGVIKAPVDKVWPVCGGFSNEHSKQFHAVIGVDLETEDLGFAKIGQTRHTKFKDIYGEARPSVHVCTKVEKYAYEFVATQTANTTLIQSFHCRVEAIPITLSNETLFSFTFTIQCQEGVDPSSAMDVYSIMFSGLVNHAQDFTY
jgi:hypothetical protein